MRDEETWIKDEEIEGTRPLFSVFHLTGLRCTCLMSLSSDFVYMHMKGCDGCLTYPHFTPRFWGRVGERRAGTDARRRLRGVARALAIGQICHGRLVRRSSPDLRVFKLP